jgi:CheY-like chemotaxis protein
VARILLVDDHADTVGILALIIAGLGHEALEAMSGSEALELVGSEPVDLILLDYMMPDLDGLEVLRSVRANPAIASLPVIIITAVNDPDVKAQALSEGATGILSKPIGREELHAALRDHLD